MNKLKESNLHYLLYGKSKTLWNVCKCLFVFVHMSDCVFVHKTCSRFTAVLLTLVSCHPIMQIEVSSVPIPASTTSNTANWPDLWPVSQIHHDLKDETFTICMQTSDNNSAVDWFWYFAGRKKNSPSVFLDLEARWSATRVYIFA